MPETVVIDCFPSSVARYADDCAIVAVDVIRATTMAVTAVASGRRCLAAADLEDALTLRDGIHGALLAGEIRGEMAKGFDMNNSPSGLAVRDDIQRPLVMLSTSGTALMLEAGKSAHGAFIASFRNFTATARHLASRPGRVAVIGAGSRGEFRMEDQMCCAWIAELFVNVGCRPEDARTAHIIERWRGAPASACEASNSVAYLRRSDQLHDYDFIIEHVDDLDIVCRMDGNEVRADRASAH
jgi:2-phosphosulfolactate phosphatase